MVFESCACFCLFRLKFLVGSSMIIIRRGDVVLTKIACQMISVFGITSGVCLNVRFYFTVIVLDYILVIQSVKESRRKTDLIEELGIYLLSQDLYD